MHSFAFVLLRIDDIVLNIDLAPTFLDMGGVPTPQHMDGRSILPLLRTRHKNVRGKWPDTFLIESSGRRETPEQIAARAAAANAVTASATSVATERTPSDEKSEEAEDEDDAADGSESICLSCTLFIGEMPFSDDKKAGSDDLSAEEDTPRATTEMTSNTKADSRSNLDETGKQDAAASGA